MTSGWRHYRYLVHNRGLLRPLAEMEAEVSSRPLYEIPKSRVAAIESRLRSGDIIGIRFARWSLHFSALDVPRGPGVAYVRRHPPLHACLGAA